ncbi:MAG: helix-turn-helix domain-containing protein [Solirubrobacteraceae bacterium]|nr:helix-turn-helix domain-containing protein [Solirubrobacteraceae bacterium]
MSSAPPRKARSDAQANRQKILQAAHFQFAQDGPDASLNEVARRAGVGVATLYRHFPARDDLVAAVYANELDELGTAVDEYLATMTPDEALTAWGQRFLEYATTKRGLGEALHAIRARGELQPKTVLTQSMDKLLEAGRAAGSIKVDDTSEDLLFAFAGLWTLPHDERFAGRAQRLLDLVLAGLRRAA